MESRAPRLYGAGDVVKPAREDGIAKAPRRNRLVWRCLQSIVEAALKAFLDVGYAEASVNHIAVAAGVSIKTLYRHFESKDDLFSAVMQAACGKMPGADLPEEPPAAWYDLPPGEALPQAGEEHLRHVLSQDQLALYRVVTRDAHRFPELGRRYHEETTGTRAAKFTGYLDLWAKREGWTVRDTRAAAQAFAGLLKAQILTKYCWACANLGRP